jgi:hypothetical protein
MAKKRRKNAAPPRTGAFLGVGGELQVEWKLYSGGVVNIDHGHPGMRQQTQARVKHPAHALDSDIEKVVRGKVQEYRDNAAVNIAAKRAAAAAITASGSTSSTGRGGGSKRMRAKVEHLDPSAGWSDYERSRGGQRHDKSLWLCDAAGEGNDGGGAGAGGPKAAAATLKPRNMSALVSQMMELAETVATMHASKSKPVPAALEVAKLLQHALVAMIDEDEMTPHV